MSESKLSLPGRDTEHAHPGSERLHGSSLCVLKTTPNKTIPLVLRIRQLKMIHHAGGPTLIKSL